MLLETTSAPHAGRGRAAPHKPAAAGRGAARAAGDKSVELIHVRELLPTTGYIRGGCSPIGMKKPFPTFIHESALLYDYIYVSAGIRGLQLKIAPQDLIDFVGANIYPL